MDERVVEVQEFRKVYGTTVAVAGLSFTVRGGEIFALIGPNGAGKTSTLECLEGLRAPDGGVLRVMGIDPWRQARRLRNLIGVQLQASALPATMRVEEAMRLFSAYHGTAPRLDLLRRMGLGEKLRTQFGALSGGQQRRLALALALAHDPPVVFLDEPAAGLDVASRADLHALLRERKANGTTFLLATHDMAEVEQLADRVAILLRGTIAASGTPRELTATGAGLTRVTVRTTGQSLADPALAFPASRRQATDDSYTLYFSHDPGPTVAAILAHIAAQGDTLIDLRVERPSLEERFLEITREGATG